MFSGYLQYNFQFELQLQCYSVSLRGVVECGWLSLFLQQMERSLWVNSGGQLELCCIIHTNPSTNAASIPNFDLYHVCFESKHQTPPEFCCSNKSIISNMTWFPELLLESFDSLPNICHV